MGFEGLAPSAPLLLFGLLLDAVFGDPQLRIHPIRLMGDTLTVFERLLRRLGMDGYAGGCVLFLLLAALWVALPSLAIFELYRWNANLGSAVHVFVVFILFAMRDLIDHVRTVRKTARQGDLPGTRAAIGMLVGRDTTKMDLDACRRAAIESLSESFVDGFLSAMFWYVLAGLPGLLLFKVASTMDSMVGYKTDRYLRFGWCGARMDDLMNYIPARLAWILLGLCAIPFRELSTTKGWKLGLRQHGVVPGPNPGWSEATMTGVLQRRLIGPIWRNGALVTDIWLGDPADPPAGSDGDVSNALRVSVLAACLSTLLAMLVLYV
ncbi:MAG TPA: adenosylcobinamide-phosphate synthase CbiB [Terriglobia bacterium]|nr:adenosylcobinamide-phosphate synthase CbiB [Terriglobia bacterium]